MSGLTAPKVAHDQDFRDISSTKQGDLGAYAETVDGRGYRYGLAGAVTLDPGKICVAATVNSNATNKAVTVAAAAGTNEVSFTAGGSLTADTYAGGYLSVTDATGEGITYSVKGHNAGTAIVVRLDDPIKVALTTSSEISLTQHPFSGVLVSIADQLDMAVGIPNISITAAYYGWFQTKGVCAALADESYAIGQELVIGSSVVGALEAHDAAGEQTVAVAIVAGVDTEYREVYLNID